MSYSLCLFLKLSYLARAVCLALMNQQFYGIGTEGPTDGHSYGLPSKGRTLVNSQTDGYFTVA